MRYLIQTVSLTLLLIFSGCSTNQLNKTTKPKIDQTLPRVDEIRVLPDMTSIALEWEQVLDKRVSGYRIYRGDLKSEKLKLIEIATIKSAYQTHFVDTNLEPNNDYIYRMSTLSYEDRESPAGQSTTIRTSPTPEPVSFIEALANMPRSIKVYWRPHSSPRVVGYIIQRATPDEAKWKDIYESKNRLEIEYIDSDLDDNAIYKYRVRAITYDDLVSAPSMMTSAKTKELPREVTNLQATKNLPKKIKLVWNDSQSSDVSFYKIYVSNNPKSGFSYKSKTTMTEFDDMIQEDGSNKFYKISTVDNDGLESDISLQLPVMGQTLPKPATPQVTLAQIQDSKAILNWSNSDEGVQNYIVYKKLKDGMFSTKTIAFKDIAEARFEDIDIIPGVEYKYSVQSVDGNGLKSEKSKEIKLFLPKLSNNLNNK